MCILTTIFKQAVQHTHLQHLIVDLVQQIAEELLGILLPALVLRSRAVPQPVNRRRLERRIARQIVQGLVAADALLAVAAALLRLARRLQPGAGRQRCEFPGQLDHGVDGRRAGLAAQCGHILGGYGPEQIIERRTGDERLQTDVHVAVVGAIDEAARPQTHWRVVDLVVLEELCGMGQGD